MKALVAIFVVVLSSAADAKTSLYARGKAVEIVYTHLDHQILVVHGASDLVCAVDPSVAAEAGLTLGEIISILNSASGRQVQIQCEFAGPDSLAKSIALDIR